MSEFDQLKNFSLELEDGALMLQFKVGSLTVRVWGQVTYVSEASIIKAKINKAKASFFNIKKKFLKIFSDQESENMWVEGDVIHIRIQNEEEVTEFDD